MKRYILGAIPPGMALCFIVILVVCLSGCSAWRGTVVPIRTEDGSGSAILAGKSADHLEWLLLSRHLVPTSDRMNVNGYIVTFTIKEAGKGDSVATDYAWLQLDKYFEAPADDVLPIILDQPISRDDTLRVEGFPNNKSVGIESPGRTYVSLPVTWVGVDCTDPNDRRVIYFVPETEPNYPYFGMSGGAVKAFLPNGQGAIVAVFSGLEFKGEFQGERRSIYAACRPAAAVLNK